MKKIKMVTCSRCKETIDKKVKQCPHCKVSRNMLQRNPVRVVLLFIVFSSIVNILIAIVTVLGSV